MRVLMLTDDVRLDRRILQEADALVKIGHEVTVLAGWSDKLQAVEMVGEVRIERINPFAGNLDDGNSTPAKPAVSGNTTANAGGSIVRSLLRVGRRCLFAPVRPVRRYLASHRELSQPEMTVFRHVRSCRPDVIHVHDLPLLRIGAFAKRHLKIPLIFDAHELYTQQPRLDEQVRSDLIRLERKYLPKSDRVITVNPFLADEIRKDYPSCKVSVVQNAVDPPEGFRPDYRYDLFRSEYGWSDDRILLMYHGWIAPERNLDVAVTGMKYVRNPRYLLIIMGYGDYMDELRELADCQGVSDRVVFVKGKKQEELLRYVASVDIGLVPYPYGRDLNSHYVSPNKLYELIVAGVPILSNDLPFVKGLVQKHNIGVCADLQTPDVFAEALDGFPADRLDEFRVNMRACRKEFTWKVESRHLIALYGNLFAKNNR